MDEERNQCLTWTQEDYIQNIEQVSATPVSRMGLKRLPVD
jgi:hypothetical protein